MPWGRPPQRDYIRHGTTTLFAALNVLDGTVIGRNMQRHRHQEFIRFLNQVEAAVPAGKPVPGHRRQHRHPQAPQALHLDCRPQTRPRRHRAGRQVSESLH